MTPAVFFGNQGRLGYPEYEVAHNVPCAAALSFETLGASFPRGFRFRLVR